MIGILDLSKSFGPQTLFEKVTLQLNAGSRYGVVGANGSGKSTFLRILMGDDTSTTGELAIPKACRLGMLRQDRFHADEELVIHVAMQGDEQAWALLQEQDALGREESPNIERIGEVAELLGALDGYSLESRAAQTLVGLGVGEASLYRPLGELSGGYKLRVLLAQALVGRPDALFLDEPTNHLDIVSIRWLEQFLASFRGCAVIVSHDHRFLNDVCTHILDVDYGTIVQYRGNYDDFVESKVSTRERKEAEITRTERAIAEKKASLERFKAKATKARQSNSKLKQLERIEIERLAPTSRRYPRFSFGVSRPSGKDVLMLEGVHKSFGDNDVVRDLSLTVRRQERVALIGANGLGKSTLLKILAGKLAADAGKVQWGHEARVGYFAQDHREQLPHGEQSVLDCLWTVCPEETTGFVRGVLGNVLFSREEVDKKVGSVSGGEAARIILARIMVEKPNVLLLDEPTNHLDLEAIEALVGALDKYEGTLIFVSHDRWFVSKLATRVVEITAAGFRDFPGTYDEYLDRAGIDHVGGGAGTAPVIKRRSEAPPKPVARAVEAEAQRAGKQRRVRRSGRTVERGTAGD